MHHDLATTKKKLRKARRLSDDQLMGFIWAELTNCPQTVAWMHELRERLKDSHGLGDKRDPRFG